MQREPEISTAGNASSTRYPRMETQAVRQSLARVLLQNAPENSPGSGHLSRRTIAQKIGTSWSVINDSLKWMQEHGVIVIDRNRITVNEDLMNQIAVNREISH